MAHLFVVAGHGAGDPGAGGYSSDGTWYDEAERVRALARRIKELGGANVTLGDMDVNYYASNGWLTEPLDTSWQAVELHMDSADEGAHGAHVITCSYGEPDEYDYALAEFIGGFFPGRSSSLVARSDLKNPKQAFARGIAYRLIENGFISDEGDLDRFNAKIDEIARGYLRVFGISTGEEPEPRQSESEATMWRCVTDPDGNRYAIAADGVHQIETDVEWWAMVGMLTKPADGSGTIRTESIAAIRDVLARKAV